MKYILKVILCCHFKTQITHDGEFYNYYTSKREDFRCDVHRLNIYKKLPVQGGIALCNKFTKLGVIKEIGDPKNFKSKFKYFLLEVALCTLVDEFIL